MSIVLEQVRVVLGGKVILDGLNLTLPDQGIVGLFGPSGCGKTTLLMTLCGLIEPRDGSITGSQNLRPAMVFQEDRLLPWLTAGDNLNIILRDQEKTQLWLERMQLSGSEQQHPHQLSGGMKRRLALARALACQADLLLLDEPFKGMDLHLKKSIYPWIRKVAENIPVLLVTHDQEELACLADQVWQADGPPLKLHA